MRHCSLLSLIIVFVLFFAAKTPAQVKIGGTPGLPHPSSVLQLDDTARGFLPASLTTTQRNNIVSPQNGLIIFNNSTSHLNIYQQGAWRELNTDSVEWLYNPSTARVELSRAYIAGDTVYFEPLSRKFLFSDKATYTNSQGLNFSPLAFGGKYNFKATASKNTDSIGAAGYALSAIYEVDSSSGNFVNSYGSIFALTTANPLATQKNYRLDGFSNTVVHAGQDSVFTVRGIANTTYTAGTGYTAGLFGIGNFTNLGVSSTGDVGSAYGILNVMQGLGTNMGHINGNLYGFLNQLVFGITSRVNGSAYGLFITDVVGAATGNYAIYTGRGRNRFGDSVLISSSAIAPRAIFDINNTSAMILPTGVGAQRPATGITGMLRYNTDNGGSTEAFNGTEWVANSPIRTNVTIDIPTISTGASYTTTVAVPGASVASSVSISPQTVLPEGVIITYARVSGISTVEVRFNLLYGASVNPPPITFYIRVFP